MATANSTTTANTAQDIQPVFDRVQQTGTHDCIFACVAMIAGKSLEEVMSVAISDLKHPRHGPFWPLVEEEIATLLAKFSLVGSVYKQITKGIVDIPAVAIVISRLTTRNPNWPACSLHSRQQQYEGGEGIHH